MRRLLTVVVALVSAAVVSGVSCGRDDASPTAESAVPDGRALGDDVDAAGGVDGAVDGGASPDADVNVPLVDTCNDAGVVPNVWLADPHLCLTRYAEAIAEARQMAFAPNGDLFVEGAGHLLATFDLDKDGVIAASERSVFADAPIGADELNHGLAFSPDGAFVYASGARTVYRCLSPACPCGRRMPCARRLRSMHEGSAL